MKAFFSVLVSFFVFVTPAFAVSPNAFRLLRGVQHTTITSSTAETTIVTADATHEEDIYGLIITNTSNTGVYVTVKDSTGGTSRLVIYVPPTETRGFTVPVESAVVQAAVNNNWTATVSGSVASVEITAFYIRSL